MKVYSIRQEQFLQLDIDQAWQFFSTAKNLGKITPSSMSFKILEPFEDVPIYSGQIINYDLKPMLGVSVRWTTEITHCIERKMFVDEQRFGPYKLWHHQHHFEPVQNGTKMIDIVHYALPFGLLGQVLNNWLIRERVESIFEFRQQKLRELFGRVS